MMQDNCVLVTGATSPIGSQIVRSLVEEGYRVVAMGRNQEKLEKLVSQEKEKQHFLEEVFRSVEKLAMR